MIATGKMINKSQLYFLVAVLIGIFTCNAQSPPTTSPSTPSNMPTTSPTTSLTTSPTMSPTTSPTTGPTNAVFNPQPNPVYPTPATSNGKDEINDQAQQLYAKLGELAQTCQSLQYNCGGQGDTCDPLTILEQMEIQTVQNACEAIMKNKASADAALQCNQSSISTGASSGPVTSGTGSPNTSNPLTSSTDTTSSPTTSPTSNTSPTPNTSTQPSSASPPSTISPPSISSPPSTTTSPTTPPPTTT